MAANTTVTTHQADDMNTLQDSHEPHHAVDKSTAAITDRMRAIYARSRPSDAFLEVVDRPWNQAALEKMLATQQLLPTQRKFAARLKRRKIERAAMATSD